MTHNLIVSPPGQEPMLYELHANRIGIGRSPDNQIRLDFDCVSYSHLELTKSDDGDYELRDLDSKNGTRLNGLSIRSSKLEDGDRILLSETIPCYYVELDNVEEPLPAVSSAPASDQKAAGAYVALHDKLHEFERKLEKVRADFESKQAEFDDLNEAIDHLQKSIKEEAAGDADQQTLDKLERDLINKTQRVSVLQDDLDGAKEQIQTLEATRKVAIKAPAASQPIPPAAPAAPVAPAFPKKPGGASWTPPKGAAALPNNPVPKKPGE